MKKETPRSHIRIGGFAKIMGGDWLVKVEEAWLDDRGDLHCSGRVISRPLCAENLVHGETHPQIFWKAA